jgi:diaminopimelate decarboxylase
LIAVDYSSESTGIHFEGFDGVFLQRPWNELDLPLYQSQVTKRVVGEGPWIPGLDLEVEWLSETCSGVHEILVPPLSALRLTSKPQIAAARDSLPVLIPESISASRSQWELFAFCRGHGWPIWVKGPNYEARACYSWLDVQRAITELEGTWASTKVFLQADVVGNEESIAFSAFEGELVDCVRMEKRALTPEGKTWSGRISNPDPAMSASVAKMLSGLKWTGGGELEFVRDSHGTLSLLDWNPRFPAWIHGATLAGHNLPGALVEAAGFGRAKRTPITAREFVRIVMEIPTRPGYPAPSPKVFRDSSVGAFSKHPSGMPLLAAKLRNQVPAEQFGPQIPNSMVRDLSRFNPDEFSTPRRVLMPETTSCAFSSVETARNKIDCGVHVGIAYSMKTNPNHTLAEMAANSGFLAETITSMEINRAQECGFQPSRIIINGPAQFWPEEIHEGAGFKAVFADSQERLESLLGMKGIAQYVGVRLKPPGVPSRFGVPVQNPETFTSLLHTLASSTLEGGLGIHFHIPTEMVGTTGWWHVYESQLRWAKAVESGSGKVVRCLDVGGGWFPDDFRSDLLARLPQAIDYAKQVLPSVESFFLEPGKAFSQPCMAVITRVLEVRRSGEHSVAVLDAATSMLPMASFYPHRTLLLDHAKDWVALGNGSDTLYGRNCMETDIIASRVHLPDSMGPGDVVAVCDAGAYDASMSYDFGRGCYFDG